MPGRGHNLVARPVSGRAYHGFGVRTTTGLNAEQESKNIQTGDGTPGIGAVSQGIYDAGKARGARSFLSRIAEIAGWYHGVPG